RLKSDISEEAHPTTKFVSIKTGIATKTECERLDLAAGAKVLRTERVRVYGGHDCMLERIVLRLDRFAGLEKILEKTRPGSLYSLLEHEFRVMIVRLTEELRAVPADAAD